QALRIDLGKAAAHEDAILRTAFAGHGDDARPQCRQYRRMTGENSHIAVGAGDIDFGDMLGQEKPFRAHQLKVQSRHVAHAASARRSALATASSMVPTM